MTARPGPMAALLTLAGALLLLAGGCGDTERRVEIATHRPVEGIDPLELTGRTDRERFARVFEMLRKPAEPGTQERPKALPQIEFDYQVPEGWQDKPRKPGSMRRVSLVTGGSPPVEVAVFLLKDSPILENVGRWYDQFGHAKPTEADLPALEFTWQGRTATRIDIEGKGDAAGSRFVGFLCRVSGRMLSAKLVGSSEVVAKQVEAFDAFLASLTPREVPASAGHAGGMSGGAGHAGMGHGGGHGVPGRGNPLGGRLTYETPAGWAGKRVDAGIRIASFQIASAKELEIGLFAMEGDSGGVRGTVTMWAEGVAAPTPDDAAVAALPRIDVLGAKAVLVELVGERTIVRDGTPVKAGVLAVYAPAGTHTVTLRATGPSDDLRRIRADFVRLAKSLELASEEEPK